MPRKPETKPAPAFDRPRSWQDCDRLVHLVAKTRDEIGRLAAAADEDTRRIAAALEAKRRPLAELEEGLQEAIETFASAHRKDLGSEQSMALAHGRVGWREAPPSVRFSRPADEIVAGLHERGLEIAILVTERPSKDILATLPEETLKELGVRLVQKEDFYVKPVEAQTSDAPVG
jgi:phage host-nuclease inhibitor protein Gam